MQIASGLNRLRDNFCPNLLIHKPISYSLVCVPTENTLSSACQLENTYKSIYST